jgi:hypothetical protein
MLDDSHSRTTYWAVIQAAWGYPPSAWKAESSQPRVTVVHLRVDRVEARFSSLSGHRERELLHSDTFKTDIQQTAAGAAMLDALGRTPDEIADSLRLRGIKGVRNTSRFLNPIVRYASSITTGVYGIDLIKRDQLRIVFANGQVTEVPVPDTVLAFLDLFHRGQYPDLEMPIGPGS